VTEGFKAGLCPGERVPFDGARVPCAGGARRLMLIVPVVISITLILRPPDPNRLILLNQTPTCGSIKRANKTFSGKLSPCHLRPMSPGPRPIRMPVPHYFVRAVILLSVVAGLSSPAKSQTASPTTTIRVTSDLVYLDVTVVDRKGNPVVTGLTKNDFTITENGKPKRIFSFDTPVAGAETSAAASPAIGSETVQVPNTKTAQKGPATILVLDLLNTPFVDSAYARDSIRRYLAKQPQRLASPTELMVLNNTAALHPQPRRPAVRASPRAPRDALQGAAGMV
jgi:hypothetical protein